MLKKFNNLQRNYSVSTFGLHYLFYIYILIGAEYFPKWTEELLSHSRDDQQVISTFLLIQTILPVDACFCTCETPSRLGPAHIICSTRSPIHTSIPCHFCGFSAHSSVWKADAWTALTLLSLLLRLTQHLVFLC